MVTINSTDVLNGAIGIVNNFSGVVGFAVAIAFILTFYTQGIGWVKKAFR
jgi:hypothetical protein